MDPQSAGSARKVRPQHLGMVFLSMLISGLTAILTSSPDGTINRLVLLNAVLQMFVCLRASYDDSPGQQAEKAALEQAAHGPPPIEAVIRALNDNPDYWNGILHAIRNSHLKETLKL